MKTTLDFLPLPSPGNQNRDTVKFPPLPRLYSRDEVFLYRVKQCARQNLTVKHFGVCDLAAALYVSVSQLNRKLNALGELSGGRLIKAERLGYAANLLASDTGSVGEIASMAGFNDQAHFCRCFKKAYHCTPSAYRRTCG